MGGRWSDKTKLILISTLVEAVVEVKVELGNKYIINLKFTKYSGEKSSGWLMCDLRRLELIVSTGHFCLLCRQGRKLARKHASKWVVSGSQVNQ